MKTFRNFGVANLFALLPLLWIVLGWMPDQVKIQWRGNAPNPVAIVSDGMVLQGESYGAWSEGTVWRFYLREGMTWKELAFRLPPGTGSGAIGRIDLQKWKLFCLGKTGTNLVPTEGVENGWHFANPRFESIGFASRSGAIGLFALEVLLLGLSWLFAKYHREERWKTLWSSVGLVALALAALMQLALPIQSYLANQSAYPFTVGALAGDLAVRFTWTFAIYAVAIGCLGRCFGRWVLGAVLAFAVCVYLESGILSTGLPDLNGDWWFFQNRTRAMWDAAVWAGVFVSFAFLHPLLMRHYGLVSTCLLVMTAAAMFDVQHEEKADTSKLLVHDFVPVGTVIRNVTYSTNRNVLVFVIDSLEREQAHAIIQDPEAGAELREKFRGFTEYADNVGAAPSSLYAVANIFTGKYLEKASGMADYFASVYSSESALKDLLDEGFSVYAGTSALGYGYTNRNRGEDSHVEGRTGVLGLAGSTGMGWSIQETDRFRWLPFCAKYRYGTILELGRMQQDDFAREWDLYPKLANAPVDSGNGKSFLFVHTDGVHEPVMRDRHGNLLPTKDDSFKGHAEMGVFVLRELAALMEAYRSKHIYDQSLILVLADHGNRIGGSQEGLPGLARPFLWIKPAGSSHDFETCPLPTSHARISAVLEAAAHRELTDGDIRQLLVSGERRFRSTSGSRRTDLLVAVDGSVREEIGMLAVPRPDELRPLTISHAYDLDMSKPSASETENILFSHLPIHPYPTWWPEDQKMEIAFRVSDPSKRYTASISFYMWSPSDGGEKGNGAGFALLRQEGNPGRKTALPAGNGNFEIQLNGIQPDSDGMVRLVGEHLEPSGFKAQIRRLMLEYEQKSN